MQIFLVIRSVLDLLYQRAQLPGKQIRANPGLNFWCDCIKSSNTPYSQMADTREKTGA